MIPAELPAPEQCVLRYLLDSQVERRGDQTFVVFDDETSWSYAELQRRVRSAAGLLSEAGIRQGDAVLVWLPNGAEALVAWFAINYAGAVFVPMNVAYKGRILEHAVNLSDARLAIVHAERAPRLADVNTGLLEQLIVVGGEIGPVGSLMIACHSLSDCGDRPAPVLSAPIMPWDTQSIIYTSGTTGPSKGVLSCYAHLYTMCVCQPLIDESDRLLITLPMYHAGGTGTIYHALIKGGSIALTHAFSTQDFWPVVARTRTTSAVIVGAMASFLVQQPDQPDTARSILRSVNAIPLDAAVVAFGKRFGVTVTTMFNMTEISSPIISGFNPTALGSCGTLRSGMAARLVDENDIEVQPGDPGELILRPDLPWSFSHGYQKDGDATARAWRNGWFHTGDRFRCDEHGNYFFLDRAKDAIRRRGENISSFEVEVELSAHPAVREAAAVAVKSEFAEDEVLAVLSLVEGASFDPAELIAFLQPRMPHFMVPRYVRIVPDLPKTPTMKVQKHLLRSEGVTADTWDREKADIVIRRERVGRP